MQLLSGGSGDQVAPAMRPGERLLWSGRPDPSRLLTGADAFLIPFSVLWGGFAVFWEISVLRSDAPVAMALFGIPLVAVGLYFIAGRFVVKRRRKATTRYAITSQRALVLRGGAVAQDMPLRGQPISIDRSRDGRHASVTIGQVSTGRFGGSANYANTGMELFSRGSTPFAFFDVADPEPMLSAIDQARQDDPRR